MTLRVRNLSAAAAVALLAGCGASSPSSGNSLPTASLTITVSPASVVANGTSTVSVTVDGSTQGTISVSTSRGTFPNGQMAVTVPSTPATLTLTSCNASADVSCAGTVTIRAIDAGGVAGSGTVAFTSAGGGTGPTCTTCGPTACQGLVCDALGHTCSTDSPSTCTTCPGGAIEICNDGIDNNCDGLIDCNDPKCQPVGNAIGAVCDAKGNTCSVLGVTGKSTCSVCSGNGGTPEAHETSCGDGKDNDCDGLVDCQDPDCGGLNCSPYGLTCNATTKTCSICPGAQNVETTCSDGIDNDCNGFIDCKDTNCQPSASAPGKSCGSFGKACTGLNGGTCECSGNGGAPQAVETSCGDGFDNDCNGKIDCEDSACSGKSCDRAGSVGKLCTAGVCTCPGGSVEICNDGIDNDCNGKIDCQDTACQPSGTTPGSFCDGNGNRCSAPTTGAASSCSVCSGNGGTAEAKETSCSDGKDNDCDGLIDCADSDCLGQACSAVNPAYVCVAVGATVTCADPTSQYSLVLTAGSNRIPADGVATTTVTATLKQNGAPLVGKVIAFASPLAGTSVSAPPLTDSNGQTSVVFTANATGGSATVTGTFAATAALNVTGQAIIALPQLGQVNLLSQQHDILGVRFSGFQETSILTFQLFDTANQPYPPGLKVDFTHQSLGRSFIGINEATCTVAIPSICSASGATDAQGRVTVLLTSGRTAGVVQVAAGASAGGLSAGGTASNIAIVGAKASGAHITMDCYFGPPADNVKNIPAFSQSDCSYSQYVTTITCRTALADRFNNVLGVSTLAQFFSEAGTAGPPGYTPQYNPTKPPTDQTTLGLAESYVRSDGKLPFDVPPFDGEFRLAYSDGCNNGTHNPRDGLVTVISIANGEEGFVDLNGNGMYDPGEPYIDMGEPYIDRNDNGKWDSGEFFVDLNRNGIYDGPNGIWDSDTVIWAETRLLFTGLPDHHPNVATGLLAGSQFYTSGLPPEPTTALPFSVKSSAPGPGTSQTYQVVLGDLNFNPLVPDAAYSILTQSGRASARYSFVPRTPRGIAMSFTQQYCTKPNLEEITSAETCANVCPSNGSTTNSPCYVVTNVGACSPGVSPRSGCNGFDYGSVGSVVISGGATTGPDSVQVTATIGGTSTSIYLDGVVVP
jgi:hypothetical protein